MLSSFGHREDRNMWQQTHTLFDTHLPSNFSGYCGCCPLSPITQDTDTVIRICVHHWHSHLESIQSLWHLSSTTFTGDGLENKYMNKQLLMDGFITFLLQAAAPKASLPSSPHHILTPSHRFPSPLSLPSSVSLSSFIFNPRSCLIRDADGHVIRTR